MERIRLYIDKENIISIVQTKDKELFDECARLVRRNIDIHYNFSKEEVIQNPYIQLWFRCVMGQGVDNEIEYSNSEDDVLPIRPVSHNDFSPDGEEDPFGIYLLKDRDACLEIENYNCVLIGAVGRETEIFQRLLRIDDADEVFAREMTTWEQYCPRLPLTDIVLCDNYYFSDRNVYKRNNNELLRVLSSVPRNFPINVVIITRSSDISPDIKLREELDNIRNIIQDASNNSDSALTIIGSRNEIHDRVLITNYYRINSTAGFQRQRYVKNDIRFDIRSHTKGKNYDITWELIKSTYQKALKNAVFCIGDQKSNYISF